LLLIKEISEWITLLLLLIKEISEWITLLLLLIKEISDWITLLLLLIKEISEGVTLLLLLIKEISEWITLLLLLIEEISEGVTLLLLLLLLLRHHSSLPHSLLHHHSTLHSLHVGLHGLVLHDHSLHVVGLLQDLPQPGVVLLHHARRPPRSLHHHELSLLGHSHHLLSAGHHDHLLLLAGHHAAGRRHRLLLLRHHPGVHHPTLLLRLLVDDVALHGHASLLLLRVHHLLPLLLLLLLHPLPHLTGLLLLDHCPDTVNKTCLVVWNKSKVSFLLARVEQDQDFDVTVTSKMYTTSKTRAHNFGQCFKRFTLGRVKQNGLGVPEVLSTDCLDEGLGDELHDELARPVLRLNLSLPVVLAGRDGAGDTVRDLLVRGAVLDLLLPLQLPAPDDLPLSLLVGSLGLLHAGLVHHPGLPLLQTHLARHTALHAGTLHTHLGSLDPHGGLMDLSTG